MEHEGHRERMLAKLGKVELPEQELLEIFLFPLLPRRNTHDIAHRLLAAFGSPLGVFSASVEALQTVEGVGERVAKSIYCTGLLFKKCRYEEGQGEGTIRLREYLNKLAKEYSEFTNEVLDVLLLDERGAVFATHRFSSKKAHEIHIKPAELSKVFLQTKPSAAIFVHNHPTQPARPSDWDDDATNRCQLVCSMHDVLMCDHIIVAKGDSYSYYLNGRMKGISQGRFVTEPFKEKDEAGGAQ